MITWFGHLCGDKLKAPVAWSRGKISGLRKVTPVSSGAKQVIDSLIGQESRQRLSNQSSLGRDVSASLKVRGKSREGVLNKYTKRTPNLKAFHSETSKYAR